MDYERLALSPSKESMRTIEECASFLSPTDQKLAEWHDSYIFCHKKRISLDLDIVKSIATQESKILEFGSIPLLFPYALSKSNYNVTGCDIAPDRYSSSIKKTGLNIVKCDIETEKLPFQDNSFDIIVFNELFEHLRINPIFTMSEVLRIMKPNASLILSTPNLRSLKGLLNFLFKNRLSKSIYHEYDKLEKLGHMGHTREYTTREMIEFLERVGFSVTKVIYRGQYNTFAQLTVKLFPSLSPYITYIVNKPQ